MMLYVAPVRRRHRVGKRKHSYETRVAACADYLLGMKLETIEKKHGVPQETVTGWIRACGCFKSRGQERKRYGHQEAQGSEA